MSTTLLLDFQILLRPWVYAMQSRARRREITKGRCNYSVDIFQIKNNRVAGFEICIKKQNSLVLKLEL